MEGAALGVGARCRIGGQVNKKVTVKAEKHEKLETLADAKLNSVLTFQKL
jgi:hypothetical protein